MSKDPFTVRIKIKALERPFAFYHCHSSSIKHKTGSCSMFTQNLTSSGARAGLFPSSLSPSAWSRDSHSARTC